LRSVLTLEIDPTLTPAEIQDLITANAVDIGASGYDGVSGWGRADALATVTAAATAADLKAASDTGTSSTDDLTKLDNSAPGKELGSSGDIELNFICHARQVGPRGCDAQDGTHPARRALRPGLDDPKLCRRVDEVK
jgi:hypothetical protein